MSSTESIYLYPLTWDILHRKNGPSTIVMVGLDTESRKHCVRVENFYPYFYITASIFGEYQKDVNILLSRIRQLTGIKGGIKSVTRHSMYKVHWYEDKPREYYKISCLNEQIMNKITRTIEQHSNEKPFIYRKCYEHNLSKYPLLNKFFLESGYMVSGWQLFKVEHVSSGLGISKLKGREHILLSMSAPKSEEIKIVPTFTTLSYDIESYTKDPNAFPNPTIRSCWCYNIAVVIKRGDEVLLKRVYLLGDLIESYHDKEFELKSYDIGCEREMILDFFSLFEEYGIDVLAGYNINVFDNFYLITRLSIVGIRNLPNFSVLKDYVPKFENFRIEASDKPRDDYVLKCAGTINLDVYLFFLTGNFIYRFKSLKLDEVSQRILNSSKEDVPYKEQFYAYKHYRKACKLSRDPKIRRRAKRLFEYIKNDFIESDYDWLKCVEPMIKVVRKSYKCSRDVAYCAVAMVLISRVVKYCLKDATLPLMLAEKCHIAPTQCGLAEDSGQVPSVTYSGSKQRKIFHLINQYCTKNNIVMNERVISRYKYKGGDVSNPLIGYHRLVLTIDVNSLYPNMMIAYNLSPDMLVWVEYDSNGNPIPRCDCEYELHTTDYGEDFYIAKNPEREGILVRIQKDLMEKRNILKKKLESATGEEAVLLKISEQKVKLEMNTIYGVTGMDSNLEKAEADGRNTDVTYAMFPCPEVSNTITLKGRHYKKNMEKIAEDNGAIVVYGDTDSIMIKLREPSEDVLEDHKKLERITELINESVPGVGVKIEDKSDVVFFGKKNYIKMMLNKDGTPKIDASGNIVFKYCGVPAARKDRPQIVVNMHSELTKMIFMYESPYNILREMIMMCAHILLGHYDYDLFTVTQVYSGQSKKGAIPKIAKRMMDCGENISEGDRITYIVTNEKGTSVGEKSMSIGEFNRIRNEQVKEYGKAELDADWWHYMKNVVGYISPIIKICSKIREGIDPSVFPPNPNRTRNRENVKDITEDAVQYVIDYVKAGKCIDDLIEICDSML